MSSQPDKPVLRLDWCSHEAAKYAVEHWHYSKCLPSGKSVKVGVWEGAFIGCIIFSQGANNHIGVPYGLNCMEVCELTRVAMTKHRTPVTRIISIAVKFLHTHCHGVKLVVSYADPEQGHHGGIYQGCGWVYAGTSQPQREVMCKGKVMHKRTANSLFGTIKGMQKSKMMWKHKYLMPLDAEIRKRIMPLSKPYPKRAVSIASDAPANHAGEGGSTPTTALHLETSCASP